MFRKQPKKARAPLSAARRIFHGVSIKVSGDFPCTAAIDLHGRRFLADEAPPLPMYGCVNPQNCRCVYKHFDDRRAGLRRESDEGMPLKDYSKDIRNGVGRRITDG